MNALEPDLQEAHYCKLTSQSNIYGLTKLNLPGDLHKTLTSSIRGEVISLEFNKNCPSTRKVNFTYIPADAEIISIDSFNKPQCLTGVVIGITFVIDSSKVIETNRIKETHQYLNIYFAWDQGLEFNLDSIAQFCSSPIELGFIPYQLTHALVFDEGSEEIVFLLSGNDKTIHIYMEDNCIHTFNEKPIENYFPEFSKITSNVLSIEIKTFKELNRRITAFSCLDGMVCVSHVDIVNKVVLQNWNSHRDSSITSVKFYSTQSENYQDYSEKQKFFGLKKQEIETTNQEINLVVTSALESSIVYTNFLELGFESPRILYGSEKYDSALSCCIADIDFDGENELLIGTYGQELLIYKLYNSKKHKNCSPYSFHKESQHDSSKETLNMDLTDGQFFLLYKKTFSDPILAIDQVDVTGDGVQEIIIVTLKGIHVLQHNLNNVAKLCIQRLKNLQKIKPNL